MKLLLPTRPSFLAYPGANEPMALPAYLLPAKTALYSNVDLLKAAHLYKDLQHLVESSSVPIAEKLNDNLRSISKDVDQYLKGAVQD